MGEQSHLKDHYSGCEGTDRMKCVTIDWSTPSTQVLDQVRWGVWLGRHICYTTTQVS